MNVGKMTHVLTIQRVSYVTNDAGDEAETWAALATLRAEQVVGSRASESIRPAGGAKDIETRIFRTRFVPGVTVTAADRVLFRGAPWNIRSVDEIGRQHGLELTCEAGP